MDRNAFSVIQTNTFPLNDFLSMSPMVMCEMESLGRSDTNWVNEYTFRAQFGTVITCMEDELDMALRHAKKMLLQELYKDIIRETDYALKAAYGHDREEVMKRLRNINLICRDEQPPQD